MGGRKTHVTLEQVCFNTFNTPEYDQSRNEHLSSSYSSETSSPMSIPSVTSYTSSDWNQLQSTSASSTEELCELFSQEERHELLAHAHHSASDMVQRMQTRLEKIAVRNTIIHSRCKLAALSINPGRSLVDPHRHCHAEPSYLPHRPPRPCSAPPRLVRTAWSLCDSQ